MQIVDCEQGSEEWFRARLGIPTASEFSTVLAQGRGGAKSIGRRTYLMKLAGEILTGEPMEPITNTHMERGKIMQEEARSFYEAMSGETVVQIGFIRNGQTGCSPDGLIKMVGALEIKTALPHILGEILLRDEFPFEHRAQCQGVLWVAEREWIDLVIYWPRMPTFVKRAYRDDVFIAHLSEEVDRFNEELQKTVELIRRAGWHHDRG